MPARCATARARSRWRTSASRSGRAAASSSGPLAAGRDLPTPGVGQPGPFGLADPEGVHRILDESGFADVDITAIDAPMWLGTDGDDAWAFVSGMGIVRGLTGGLDDDLKQDALDRLREVIDTHETPNGVALGAAEWLITARA